MALQPRWLCEAGITLGCIHIRSLSFLSTSAPLLRRFGGAASEQADVCATAHHPKQSHVRALVPTTAWHPCAKSCLLLCCLDTLSCACQILFSPFFWLWSHSLDQAGCCCCSKQAHAVQLLPASASRDVAAEMPSQGVQQAAACQRSWMQPLHFTIIGSVSAHSLVLHHSDLTGSLLQLVTPEG